MVQDRAQWRECIQGTRSTPVIIIGVLPYGRSLAPNSSILLYSLLFSSSSQRNLPSAPLAYQSLVCPSASCPPFYPPSLLLIVLLLAKHVQSNSFSLHNRLH